MGTRSRRTPCRASASRRRTRRSRDSGQDARSTGVLAACAVGEAAAGLRNQPHGEDEAPGERLPSVEEPERGAQPVLSRPIQRVHDELGVPSEPPGPEGRPLRVPGTHVDAQLTPRRDRTAGRGLGSGARRGRRLAPRSAPAAPRAAGRPRGAEHPAARPRWAGTTAARLEGMGPGAQEGATPAPGRNAWSSSALRAARRRERRGPTIGASPSVAWSRR